MKTVSSPRCVALLVMPIITGCGSEGGGGYPAPRLAPPDASAPGSDAGSDSAVPDDAGRPDADAAVVAKRTVFTRDPFGNYAVIDNLLSDGDFEWATDFASQYPWIRYPGENTLPDLRMGASCRSGMRCAAIARGAGIAGFAVRPPGAAGEMQLSLWVRADGPSSCANLRVSLSNCFLSGADSQLDASAYGEPDQDGWCHVQGALPTPNDTPCLFLSANASVSGVLIIDDVVASKAPASTRSRRTRAPDTQHARLVAQMREVARRRLRPLPPTPPDVPSGLKGKMR
ncbi:MAG: hypothetical protein MUF54_13965 [Polyangiaceae bacterium]|jgi:hypothetical protein|nr:hypothetical protein [Polyangiaceae bacterium]